MIPLLCALPPSLSGPLRVLTGWPLGVTLGLAIGVTVPLVGLAGRALRLADDGPGWIRLVRAAAPIALAGLAITLLWNRDFGGLVEWVGADAGNHAAYRERFVAERPDVYQGFVAMYALWWWVERASGWNAFRSFEVVYYLIVFFVAALPALLAFSSLRRDQAGGRAAQVAWAAGAIAGIAAGAAVLRFATLPLLHYHQSEGFFAHLFGLVPLLAMWTWDGLARRPIARAGGALASLFMVRYTYGLNLGDLALACAAILALEARAVGAGRSRLLLALLALAAAGSALPIYRALRPIGEVQGWIVPYATKPTVRGLAAALAGCAMALLSGRALVGGSGIGRLLRVPLAFGVPSAAVYAALLRWPPPHVYYFLKYSLHAVVLLGAASSVAVAALTAGTARALLERRRPWRGFACAVAALALFGFALRELHRGVQVYLPSFEERAFGHPPYALNLPLADLDAWRRIDATLARRKARFGGYLSAFAPLASFMNGALGLGENGQVKRPIERPGYCVFWETDGKERWPAYHERTYPLKQVRARLWSDPRRICESYVPAWSPARPRELCHLCYE